MERGSTESGDLNPSITRVIANGKVYINGIEGFWSFAKERLLKYHGVDAGKFPLYLKELEFRYNHRDRDLFDDLVQVLVGYSRVAYTE